MARNNERLSIGKVAERTGLAVSAIHHYEDLGLVHPARNAGNQRLFLPSDIRRLSFVMIAQQLGFSLEDIREQLKSLPEGRTPSKADWTQISSVFREAIQARIDMATRMRDRLDGCIGCGCLSLSKCDLYNAEDRLRRFGVGPQQILGDHPSN